MLGLVERGVNASRRPSWYFLRMSDAARKVRTYVARVGYTLDYLQELSPRAFEVAIAALYQARGARVALTPAVNDEGRDLLITWKAGEVDLVECKRYITSSVGRPHVQKLFGAATAEKASATIVNTGRFTVEAQRFASKTGVTLIGPAELIRLWDSTFLRGMVDRRARAGSNRPNQPDPVELEGIT